MRRATILLAVMGLAILLSAGMALAANITCKGGVCVGTNKFDSMKGSLGRDLMKGRGGNDRMNGGRGNDVMRGENGFDTMYGGYGSDRMYGQASNDTMLGGAAHDRIYGGPGKDTIRGESGADYIVVAGDREPDSIDCGLGNDTAVVDAVADMNNATLIDFIQVTSCERVILR